MWNLTSYKSKLMLIIMPTVALGLLAISLTAYMGISRLLEEELSKSMLEITRQNAKSINNWLVARLEETEEVAATSAAKAIINHEFAAIDEVNLNRARYYRSKYPDIFQDFFLADQNGDTHYVSKEYITLTDDIKRRAYFANIMAGSPMHIVPPIVNKITGKPTIFMVAPIRDEQNRPRGLIGTGVYLTAVQKMVDSLKWGQTGYGVMIAQDGLAIQHPDKDMIMNMKITEEDDPTVRELGNRMLAGQEGVFRYTYNGIKKIAFYHPIPISGWAVATLISEEEFFAPLQTITKVISLSMVVIMLAVMVMLAYAAQRLTRPIQILRDECLLLAQGDLREQAAPIISADEIGQLTEGFRTMRANLRSMMQELERKNVSLQCEVAQREETQRILAVSEEKFNKAFHCSSDVIALVRLRDWSYMEINDTFITVLGYNHEDVVNHNSNELNLWADCNEQTIVHEAINTTGSISNIEIHWRYKTGEIRVGRFSAEVITVNDEKCILVSWHDITDIKDAELALRQSNEQLESKVEQRTQELMAMNQELTAVNDELSYMLKNLKSAQEQLVQAEKMASLGNLVAGISHEVNTPLGIGVTAITHLQQITNMIVAAYDNRTLTSQQLEDYFTDCREAVEMVVLNLNRAAQLIKSFKQVSADQSSEARRIFNVKSYVEEVLLSLRPKLKKTNLTLEVCCEETLQIDGFPGFLAQIISNLVMNSLLHAYEPKDDGKITIKTWKADGWLHIIYMDDGKGITPEVLNKIFDPFFTTKMGTGSGLGLYILYNIVHQRLGGTIECSSQPGQGVKFTICWPLQR